ncbi:hypothetical protein V1520DRAFT_324763 [Lipomyces starkeyi]
MSSGGPPPGPPPSAAPPVPDGWLAKYDTNYNTYYYVNLSTGKSQWEKPPGADQPPAYSATQGQRQQPQMSHQNRGPAGNHGGYGGGGYGQPYPQPYPQQGYYPQQPYYPQQGYYPQQQQPVYVQQQQQQPQRSGMGAGTGMALGAAGGLVGGMLLADAMSPDVVVVDQGGDYGGDGDFGGGDFGGGF